MDWAWHERDPQAPADLIDLAKSHLPAAETAMRPAMMTERQRILGQLMLHEYPVPKVVREARALTEAGGNGQAAMAAWWADYDQALDGVPAWALVEATAEWKRSPAKFYPTPGQLLAIVRKLDSLSRARDDLAKLRKLAAAKPEPRPKTAAEIAAEDAEVARLMNAYRARKAQREAA